ncbi:ribbon-helix-helix protein, CopG family [Cellulomonas composti]|uniref:Antitoxin MazE6 n=1 Tax=Cellulomonas composti TaxID=266130 RepID=A0A511JC02_9CELL|nr:ribbon-helix-helix protein, CopG family [Cellulomonas composti]GEL95521.1 antitoxin MazE6 [Cellulomonas composti]
MKTAISVPDDTFSAVEARADELGMSRSEFFTRGAELLLERTAGDSVRERIDLVVEYVGAADASQSAAVAAGRRVLEADGDDW